MSSGRFKKGHKPWNLGRKGIRLSPKTEFKKGITTGDNHPSWKGGEQVVKSDCVYLFAGTNKRVRRPKKVYEDANGKIPKGWIIYHLDKDRHNDNLENLIAIPRAVLLKINRGEININYFKIKKEVENYENLQRTRAIN